MQHATLAKIALSALVLVGGAGVLVYSSASSAQHSVGRRCSSQVASLALIVPPRIVPRPDGASGPAPRTGTKVPDTPVGRTGVPVRSAAVASDMRRPGEGRRTMPQGAHR